MRSLLKKITGICLLTVISVCMIIPSAGCSTKNAKNKYKLQISTFLSKMCTILESKKNKYKLQIYTPLLKKCINLELCRFLKPVNAEQRNCKICLCSILVLSWKCSKLMYKMECFFAKKCTIWSLFIAFFLNIWYNARKTYGQNGVHK